MKRFYGLPALFLAIWFLASTSGSASAEGTVPQKVLDAADSVVRVVAEYADGYSSGSGFVFVSDRDRTLVVTNYHVVGDNPYSISIWVSEEETADFAGDLTA